MEAREHIEELTELGAHYVTIAGRAPEQAAHLRDDRGVTDVSLLLDPEQLFRARVGLGRLSTTGILSPRGLWNYVRSFGRGRAPGRIVEGWDLRPGVYLVDDSLEVTARWEGRTYGDYPPIGDVLDELRRRAGEH